MVIDKKSPIPQTYDLLSKTNPKISDATRTVKEYTMQVSAEFEQCRQQAYALALRMLSNRDDALEVVQTSIEKGLNHPGAPALDHAEFKPWLFTVVRNKSIDILRRKKRLPHVEHEDYHTQAPQSSEPDRSLQQLQLKETIELALEQLNMQQKEIVLLRDYHNFSYADIAKILGIAKGSVMSRLHRARMALREILIAKGITLGGPS